MYRAAPGVSQHPACPGGEGALALGFRESSGLGLSGLGTVEKPATLRCSSQRCHRR